MSSKKLDLKRCFDLPHLKKGCTSRLSGNLFLSSIISNTRSNWGGVSANGKKSTFLWLITNEISCDSVFVVENTTESTQLKSPSKHFLTSAS